MVHKHACECDGNHDHSHGHNQRHSHNHSQSRVGTDEAQPRRTGGAQPSHSYRIEGMDCADCAFRLEKVIGALPGVDQVAVNFGAARMAVQYSGNNAAAIVTAVGRAGYTAVRETERQYFATEQRSFWLRNKKAKYTLLSGLLFCIAWMMSYTPDMPDITVRLFYAAAILAGGFPIARSAVFSLKSRTIGIDLLMTVAVIGAMAIGEWMEGAAVVVLFSLGETLEALTMDRTRRSIRGLMDLAPAEAQVRRDGQIVTMAVDEIAVGDVLIVKPGEKIAMDGIVVSGQSYVNQAPITGESLPVQKEVGDAVFAGTMNEQGSLEIEVNRLHQDNTISRVIQMVEEAQAQKATSQRFVDVFAKYYTPAVMILALALVIIPVAVLGLPFDKWLYMALMLLVVACPCALVISTPVSIISAIGHAAKKGILIKGGAHLEQLGSVSAIAFDKTGTLTRGIPHVSRIIPLGQHTEDEVLRIAAAIEAHSEHPIAGAIVRLADERQIDYTRADQFMSITGRGAQGVVNGTSYYAGSPRWFREQDMYEDVQHEIAVSEFEQAGETVVLIGSESERIGMIAVSDELRESSRAVIADLRQAGIARSIMLTGDNEGTARAVSSRLDRIDYRAQLLPQDKVEALRELMRDGRVAMVGDGVNDAPALAAATVGIAMGAAGSDTALETADIALMGDDLTKLPYAIRLSRRTVKIIKQNIIISLAVKALFFALIFSGHSTLWMAVLADTGTSLLVIANGMRLLRSHHSLAASRL